MWEVGVGCRLELAAGDEVIGSGVIDAEGTIVLTDVKLLELVL